MQEAPQAPSQPSETPEVDFPVLRNFKPLGDRLIVQVHKAEEITKSGIILSPGAQEKQVKADVISVGPGRYENGQLVPLGVRAGDQVIFGKYSGAEVKMDGYDLLILREVDCLACWSRDDREQPAEES